MRDEDGCLPVVVTGVLVAVCAFFLGRDVGHDQGVKDHAAGRYVVVPMPDGTERVCEVKEAGKAEGDK